MTSNERGSKRYRPHMIAEKGIVMLSGVFRSDVVVRVSIRIKTLLLKCCALLRIMHLTPLGERKTIKR